MRNGKAMRKGDLTRQRIIARSAPLFNRRGFAGCSMQDVMEATGLEKGGLYRHFNCKQDLAAEVFRYSVERAVKLRTDHLDRTLGSVELLRSYVKRFVETNSTVPGGCPLMNTAIDADDGNLVLRDLARKGFSEWRARLSGIVAEGVRRGEIRRKTVPRRVANTMIATLEGALMLSRLDGKKTALQDARAALELMLDRLASR